MEHYKNIKQCRICGSELLTEVIHIDAQHLSPTFVKSNENNRLSEIKVPLTLTLCDRKKNPDGCGLLQLKETVEPDLLYRNYFYRTVVSDTMCKDLHNVVEDVIQHLTLNDGDYVMDIGANDCTMLSYFPASLNRIAVEPAKNIDWSNVDPSIKIVNDYFSKDAVKESIEGRTVKAITCCATFYDLDDPNSFVSDIKSVLAPDGIWCIQLSYLPLMLKNINFYDICNEHLEYYSLHTLKNLMERHNLSIFDASTNQVNGGSVRVFITHTENNRKPSANLERLYADEERMNLYDAVTYQNFYKKIVDLKNKVNNFIAQEINKGKLVLGLGASTKGNILLQLFGITKEILPAISERNPEKVGLRTLGTDIELISEEKAREMNPGCMLVLPWYFKQEIVKRETDYLQQGGKLLFPMPYPHIVDKNGETNLEKPLDSEKRPIVPSLNHKNHMNSLLKNYLTDKKILVTGAHGFLGKHLVRNLLEKRKIPKENLFLPTIEELDLRKWENCRKAVKGQDIVIHLAAKVGGIGYSRKNPGEIFYDTAIMGIQLMEAARQAGVEKFVAIGSVCAYAKFAPIPFKEQDLWNGYPEETNAPYGVAKRALLVQAQAYRNQYGFNAIYPLLVNFYGPDDNFDLQSSHVIPALIRKVYEAKKQGRNYIEVWGTGKATREFLYVEDAAEGVLLATEKYNKPEPVNIGAGREISIKELIKLICKLVDFKGEIRWDTSKPDGQPRRCLDTSKAEKEFGFKAATSFEQGLKKTINWYKQELNI